MCAGDARAAGRRAVPHRRGDHRDDRRRHRRVARRSASASRCCACVAAGMLGRPGGYALGWAVQVVVDRASASWSPRCSSSASCSRRCGPRRTSSGSKIDREKAERAVLEEQWRPSTAPRPDRTRPTAALGCAMSTQRTLVLLKPDTVRRGLVGNVLSRFEAKGLSARGAGAAHHRRAQADEHYAEHVDRDFYPPLRDFVTSGPLRRRGPRGRRGRRGGPRAQRRHRRPQGRPRHHPRRPVAVQPREPRARLGLPESAEREIAIWFPEL